MQSKVFFLYPLLSIPLFAQWTVKTRKVEKISKDEHVNLVVNLPVLTGENNPQVRKSINAALGKLSEVDRLLVEANKAIKNHLQKLKHEKSTTGDDDYDDDSPFSYYLDYEVGINDKHFFAISYTINSQTSGGVTGDNTITPANFFVSTGIPVELEELLLPNFDGELRKLFQSELSKEPEILSQNWKQSLLTVKYEFMLDKDAIIFYFPKYSLGPGSSAVISVSLSYKILRPLIPPSSPIAYLTRDQ